MADIRKFQTHEVLNKVLNTGEDALKVDIDNVTLTTEGGDVAIDVALDKANDTITVFSNTAKDGSGTSYVPLVDSDGHLQVDTVSAALPSGAATEAKQDVIETTLTAIETDAAAIEVLITSTNSKIDTLDSVLDNILVKNTEIDSVLDTIKVDTEAIETAVELLDNAISGNEMQVDVLTIAAGDNNIGNVDIASSLPAGDNNIGNVDIASALPAGSNAIGKLAANSGVDIGDVDVTSIVPGTGATNLGKAEDAAHSSGDVGVMPLAVRNDLPEALGGADGDYSPLQVNAAGSLYTKDETGEAGSILVTGTTAVTSAISNTVFIAIQFIEDTVFDSGNDGLISNVDQRYPSTQFTGTDIDSNGGAVADGVTFPQGMTIFGRWSGFKLASGKVIAYLGHV
tara:strand:+ start:990 stop:2183 length:1194 start_codon:yes stop_codon:yes gene_type:complete